MNREEILNCKNKSELCRKLNYPTNGVGYKKTEDYLIENGLTLDIFNQRLNYDNNSKYCKNCEKKISFEKKENNFCSKSCAATYNNKQRLLSDETKTKISKTLLKYYENNTHVNFGKIFEKNKIKNFIEIERECLECGCFFVLSGSSVRTMSKRKFCSIECREKSRSRKLSVAIQERIKNGTHNGWNSRNILSYPERFFIEVLKNNNLYEKCQINYSINKKKDLEIDETFSYFLDFYFEEKKICLEIDGKQHEERKEHDIKRDERLNNVGIKVYRIKWKSINNNKGKKYIKNEINNFLDFYKNN